MEHDSTMQFRSITKDREVVTCMCQTHSKFIGRVDDYSHAEDILQLPGPKFQMQCFQIANYTSTDIHKFSLPHSNDTLCSVS